MTVFVVKNYDEEYAPDIFRNLNDARDFLIECIGRWGIDVSKVRYTQSVDVNNMILQIYKDGNGNSIAYIQEFEVK